MFLDEFADVVSKCLFGYVAVDAYDDLASARVSSTITAPRVGISLVSACLPICSAGLRAVRHRLYGSMTPRGNFTIAQHSTTGLFSTAVLVHSIQSGVASSMHHAAIIM